MLRPRSRVVEKMYYAYLRMCLAFTGLLFKSGPAALNCKQYFIHALEMFYSAEELSVVLEELGYVDVTAETVLYGMLGFHRAAKPRPD
jgi:demethylmenaquinone methyltransferase/2-methoxy-6-polyprenyl-1,4-benzoquinol methylase